MRRDPSRRVGVARIAVCGLWLNGLLTGCLSTSSELELDRRPVPTLEIGRVQGGGTDCAGTLVAPNKVLTLASCVTAEDPSSVTFTSGDERESEVVFISSQDPIAGVFREADTDSAANEPDRRALLTLEDSLPVTNRIEWDSWLTEQQHVWIHTWNSQEERRLLACERRDEPELWFACPAGQRRRGGFAVTIEDDELVGVGLDRGGREPALEFDDFFAIPDRISSIAFRLSVQVDRAAPSLDVADPDWQRTSRLFGEDWAVGVETPFAAQSIAFFDDRGDERCVGVDDAGELWLQGDSWERLDAPVLGRAVSVLDADERTVIWLLGEAGEVCRQEHLPRAGGWRCGSTLPGAMGLTTAWLSSAPEDGTNEFVLVGGAMGVRAQGFEAGEFSEATDFGPDATAYTAVHLGQLQSGRHYALAAREDGRLFVRTLGQSASWSEWSAFSAGSLGAGVRALAGAHVPGWPEQIYALVAGRLHYTIQRTLPASEASDPPSALSDPGFEPWR